MTANRIGKEQLKSLICRKINIHADDMIRMDIVRRSLNARGKMSGRPLITGSGAAGLFL